MIWCVEWTNQCVVGDYVEADLILDNGDGKTIRYGIHFKNEGDIETQLNEMAQTYATRANEQAKTEAYLVQLEATVNQIDPIDNDAEQRLAVLCANLGIDFGFVVPAMRIGCQKVLLETLRSAPRI